MSNLLEYFEKHIGQFVDECRKDLKKHDEDHDGNKAALRRARVAMGKVKNAVTDFKKETMA